MTIAASVPVPRIVLEKRMSPQEKVSLKQSWQKVLPMADDAARLFYDRLFQIDPTTRPLFQATNLKDQRQKLIQALTVVVRSIDHMEGLAPTLADLGRRHAQYGVSKAHYDSVGEALLWTLEQGLGSAWTLELRAAWTSAYDMLADIMRGGAST
jgi:hemoglobin-like flavoprotein